MLDWLPQGPDRLALIMLFIVVPGMGIHLLREEIRLRGRTRDAHPVQQEEHHD